MKEKNPRIIGISGLIGSGKDTIADYLANNHGFRRESFAGSLKDAVAVVFGWDRVLLEGRTKESREWREQIDTWWATKLNIPHLTPRWVLQHWGTEVLRKGFHDDIWVASVSNKLRRTNDSIVITDVRFVNEITALREQGGICVRVKRGPDPSWMPYAIQYMGSCAGTPVCVESKEVLDREKIHASEYSWSAVKFDKIITNDGTIDQLHEQLLDLI